MKSIFVSYNNTFKYFQVRKSIFVRYSDWWVPMGGFCAIAAAAVDGNWAGWVKIEIVCRENKSRCKISKHANGRSFVFY